MKKLFSKIDQSGQQNPLIGKVFVIGKFTVTVEEVIAQGIFKMNNAMFKKIIVYVSHF